MKEAGFTQLSNSLLYVICDVKGTKKRIPTGLSLALNGFYHLLKSYCIKIPNVAYPTISTLGELAGSSATVQRHLDFLHKNQFITTLIFKDIRQDRKFRNAYVLNEINQEATVKYFTKNHTKKNLLPVTTKSTYCIEEIQNALNDYKKDIYSFVCEKPLF